MKGLLLKDLYMVTRYNRSFAFVILVFLVTAVFSTSVSFFIMYPVVFMSMIPLTLLSYDESFKWHIYGLTMPISRKTMVNEKYIIALICMAVSILLSTISLYAKYRIGNMEWDALIPTIELLFISALILPTIEFPLLFKFGPQKARIIYVALIGLATGGSVVMFGDTTNSTLFGINASFILCTFAAIVLFAVSWILSINFFEKREL